MRALKIASRGSKLAMIQSNYICKMLEKLVSGIDISIVKVSTKGDSDKSDFLYKTDSKGFFTSEVEKAIIDGRADLAVHSLKDLPTQLPDGLRIGAVTAREDPADVVVSKNDLTLAQFEEGVVVLTNPQVDLETENPTVPVLDGKQLKSFLRNLSKERPIPGSQRKQLAEILADEAPE